MARKSRIEFEGACYHVISRSNYHTWIFETEGARKSFQKCLEEACSSMEWRWHGWCLIDGQSLQRIQDWIICAVQNIKLINKARKAAEESGRIESSPTFKQFGSKNRPVTSSATPHAKLKHY